MVLNRRLEPIFKDYWNVRSKGFVKSPNEHTFYRRTDGSDNILLVCIYVDNIVYLSSSQEMVKENAGGLWSETRQCNQNLV